MSTEPEDRVRYVVAGMPTGWAAMSKTIRELDEDKVKDYKEDIDTLLVFTGLFSAVLTAFVIVSYPMLSPNPQDTTNQYLAQISAQINIDTVVAGAIDLPTPSGSQLSPPFTPSLAALRINYCWFASLIASLVTASFAMLVKQWLREYLAYEYTSPQERLRARQFRHPGIATWKVYEIAGFLPLLLQLALALFFFGLCFFTQSDDHGIGDMCAALVALWASFLVAATIAPAFSPRCPYKTPFLKPVMRSLRRHHVIHLPHRLSNIVSYLLSSLRLCREDPQILFDIIFSFPASAICIIIAFVFYFIGTFVHYIQSISLNLYEGTEETEAIKASANELSILSEVDGALLDDDLLGTTMLDSLKQSEAKPSDIIDFVIQATSLRLQGRALRRPLTRPPDLRQLSKRVWVAVSDMAAATIQNGLSARSTASGTQSRNESWIQEAFCLLFADSNHQLTSNAQHAILRALHRTIESSSPQVTNSFRRAASSITADRYHVIMHPILTHFHTLLSQQEAQPEKIVPFVLTLLAQPNGLPPSVPLSSTLNVQSASDHVLQFSLSLLGSTVETSFGRDSGPWLEDAIHILLALFYRLPRAGRSILIRLCSDATYRGRLASCIRSSACGVSEGLGFDEILDAFREVQPKEIVAFVITLLSHPNAPPPTIPLSSILDLQSVSEPVWRFSLSILGSTIKDCVEQSQQIGPWLEDAIYVLLSPSSHKLLYAGNDALVRLCSEVTLRERLTSCIRSMTSSIGEVFLPYHSLDALRNIQPQEIVAFVTTLLIESHHATGTPSLPLSSVLDLTLVSEPAWRFSSNLLGSTIEACLGRDRGPWLEDAIYILLSPSGYPLTSTGSKALSRLSAENASFESLSKCIRVLASPTQKDYVQILSRLQDSIMCQDLPDNGYSDWCLREIVYSIPCTARCIHSAECLAPLLADHTHDAPGHDEWTKHFTSILVERCRAIFHTAGGTWPPGSTESIRALMSLPVSSHSLNPAIPDVVFALVCTFKYSMDTLRPLVSVEPDCQSWVVPDAAVDCVTSLAANANMRDRQTFIYVMCDACDAYLSEEMRTKYPQVGNINLVRHCVLVSTVHANIQSDAALSNDWVKYYTACAEAMLLFRTTEYLTLSYEKKAETVRLAEECLGTLDGMEPTTEAFTKWEARFNVEMSVFPDAIFQALVAFVSDVDVAARRFKRVRRLWKIGLISRGGVFSAPASDPMHSTAGAVNIMRRVRFAGDIKPMAH